MPGPVTEPALESTWTVSLGRAPKDAVTFLSPFMVSAHVVRVPPHEPPQPRKEKPPFARAVRVTFWPGRKVAVQVPGQLMPPPLTLPLLGAWTVSRGGTPNEADTVLSPFMVSVHVVPVPPQEPPQPRKMNDPAGVAVSVTDRPGPSAASRVPGQGVPP